jgi:hypothetical protein
MSCAKIIAKKNINETTIAPIKVITPTNSCYVELEDLNLVRSGDIILSGMK